jgi:hypothetical protein
VCSDSASKAACLDKLGYEPANTKSAPSRRVGACDPEFFQRESRLVVFEQECAELFAGWRNRTRSNQQSFQHGFKIKRRATKKLISSGNWYTA